MENKHISFIMDGNRRYAKKMKISENDSYLLGKNKVYKIIKHLEQQHTFEFISFFVFSMDNNKRQNWNCLDLKKDGDSDIKQIFQEFKCKVIGDTKSLPLHFQSNFNKYMKMNNEISEFKSKIVIVFFINYSGVYDVESTVKACQNQSIANFQNILDNSLVKDIPPIDILIRTGNRNRISNFAIFLLLYSEIYFSKKLWPEFSIQDLEKILKYNEENRFCSFGN